MFVFGKDKMLYVYSNQEFMLLAIKEMQESKYSTNTALLRAAEFALQIDDENSTVATIVKDRSGLINARYSHKIDMLLRLISFIQEDQEKNVKLQPWSDKEV